MTTCLRLVCYAIIAAACLWPRAVAAHPDAWAADPLDPMGQYLLVAANPQNAQRHEHPVAPEEPHLALASGTVHVQVRDELGAPTATRFYNTASDGLSYTPVGAMQRMTNAGDTFYYVPGDFTIALPDGPTTFTFAKGFEYSVAETTATVLNGQITTVTVTLERWIDMASQGWYSGDGHIHMSYGGALSVGPADVQLMMQAEDLNYGNMVVANIWGNDVQDAAHFTGAAHPLSTPRHIMRWNEEFRNNTGRANWNGLGHMSLYALTSLVYPIYTGFASTPNPYDYPLNCDIADQAVAQGGYAAADHVSNWSEWRGGEAIVGTALGKMGSLEIAGYGAWFDNAFGVERKMWNLGMPIVSTAGTDSFLNVAQRDPLGGFRCYAQVSGPFNDTTWLDAVKAGRTFVSSAPMLFLTVDGNSPSLTTVTLTGAPPSVTLHAQAVSPWPLTNLKVYYNGAVVAQVDASGAQTELIYDGTLPTPDTGWIAAQCSGPNNRFVFGGSIFTGYPQSAATSPVWISVNGQPIPPSADAVDLLSYMDGFLADAEAYGVYANNTQRQHMRDVYGAARAFYAQMAQRYYDSLPNARVEAWGAFE